MLFSLPLSLSGLSLDYPRTQKHPSEAQDDDHNIYHTATHVYYYPDSSLYLKTQFSLTI